MKTFFLTSHALVLRVAAICVALVSLLAPANNAQADTEPARCHYVNVANLPVKFENRQVIAQGGINGQATTMLIDTGAQTTQVTGQGAAHLGLILEHSRISSVGFGGESETYATTVDEISLDKLHIKRRMHFLVTEDVAVPYGAIVGADILMNRDLEISLAGQQIKFFEPKGCDDAFLAYWDKNASDAPLSELSSRDSRQVVTVEINGQKMRALVDSGAQFSLIDLAAAARVGVTPQSSASRELGNMTGIGKHRVKAWIGSFDSFTIGDETTKNAKIGMMDLWGALKSDRNNMAAVEYADQQPEMILGADFLHAHHVLLALSQRRMYFSYLGGSVFWAGSK